MTLEVALSAEFKILVEIPDAINWSISLTNKTIHLSMMVLCHISCFQFSTAP